MILLYNTEKDFGIATRCNFVDDFAGKCGRNVQKLVNGIQEDECEWLYLHELLYPSNANLVSIFPFSIYIPYIQRTCPPLCFFHRFSVGSNLIYDGICNRRKIPYAAHWWIVNYKCITFGRTTYISMQNISSIDTGSYRERKYWSNSINR